MNKSELTKVTVICPFFRGEKYLHDFVMSVKGQDYDDEYFEVIIVDNGINENVNVRTINHDIRVIHAPERESSYYARNVGIAHAHGDLIAFIDIDCVASVDWLVNGVKAIAGSENRIVAGCVEMKPKYLRSAWHYFDAVYNINNERSVTRGFAKTANLFVPLKIFQEIGMFDETRISGGDVEWTRRAVAAGYELVYEPSAVVRHPTRGMLGQIKKQLRVGGGRSVVVSQHSAEEFSICRRITANIEYLDSAARKDGKSFWFRMRLKAVYVIQLLTSVIGTLLARFGLRFNW